MRAEKIRWS